MRLPILAAAVLGAVLFAPAVGQAHVTSRTHYHTIHGKRVWHRAATPSVHTAVNGWYGHIARHATVRNRNLVIDFDNGHRRTVEVPKNIRIMKRGKEVSVHSLDSNERVRVWAYRIPGAQGAWRATRLIAY